MLLNGKALMLTYPMEVKSIITSPSTGLALRQPGVYEITGLAWSGGGKIARVEVSADGGRSWAEAALAEPVLREVVHALPDGVALERRAGGAR